MPSPRPGGLRRSVRERRWDDAQGAKVCRKRLPRLPPGTQRLPCMPALLSVCAYVCACVRLSFVLFLFRRVVVPSQLSFPFFFVSSLHTIHCPDFDPCFAFLTRVRLSLSSGYFFLGGGVVNVADYGG